MSLFESTLIGIALLSTGIQFYFDRKRIDNIEKRLDNLNKSNPICKSDVTPHYKRNVSRTDSI